jgi:hypothetical protein
MVWVHGWPRGVAMNCWKNFRIGVDTELVLSSFGYLPNGTGYIFGRRRICQIRCTCLLQEWYRNSLTSLWGQCP